MAADPLTKAIEAAGGAPVFCSVLSISSRTLYDWRKKGVPDFRAHSVARVSRGIVSAAELAEQRIRLLAPDEPSRASA